MKIYGIVGVKLNNLSFTSNNNFRDILTQKIKEQLRIESNDSGDVFAPSTSSQPIIIEKLEINQGGKEESKNEQSVEKILTGGGAVVGGASVVSVIKNGDKSANEVDTKKIIEDHANEYISKENDCDETEKIENDDSIEYSDYEEFDNDD